MEALSAKVNETVKLMVRVGTKVRFLSTIEGTNALRVGDRQESGMPASKASGGKAILAELDPEMVRTLFSSGTAEISGDSIPAHDLS